MFLNITSSKKRDFNLKQAVYPVDWTRHSTFCSGDWTVRGKGLPTFWAGVQVASALNQKPRSPSFGARTRREIPEVKVDGIVNGVVVVCERLIMTVFDCEEEGVQECSFS